MRPIEKLLTVYGDINYIVKHYCKCVPLAISDS